MNHKARAAIAEYRMLKQGDRVAAAVSGGADSVALLDFLCSLTGLGLTVRACHLNHCLRGEESDRDEQLVRRPGPPGPGVRRHLLRLLPAGGRDLCVPDLLRPGPGELRPGSVKKL